MELDTEQVNDLEHAQVGEVVHGFKIVERSVDHLDGRHTTFHNMILSDSTDRTYRLDYERLRAGFMDIMEDTIDIVRVMSVEVGDTTNEWREL